MGKRNLVETKEFNAWINGIYGHFEDALYDSLFEKKSKFLIWRAPDVYFITMIDSILTKDSATRESLESLVTERLMGWHRISIWSCMAAYHGSYESVARELRFLIEDAVQALRADQKNPDATIDEKLEWLEMNRLRGKTLIDATELALDLKSQLKDVYHELCDFVHPSVELIQRDIENRRILFKYDENYFDKMFDFHTRVFDLVLALILHRFPYAIEEFLEYQSIEELEKDGYNSSIAIIGYHMK